MPNNEPKKRRGCLIPLAIFAVVLIAIIGGIAAGVSGTAGQKPKSLLAETIGLTEQQERDLLEVFDACGVLEVKEVTQFYVDGAVVAQVPSFYVSSAQCDEYRVSVQLLVKECLSHPDSAQFGSASKWAFGVNEDGYDVIQSSVTAQNAMGVESTEKFQVLIDRSTGAPVSLNIGGTEYIQQ